MGPAVNLGQILVRGSRYPPAVRHPPEYRPLRALQFEYTPPYPLVVQHKNILIGLKSVFTNHF